MKPARHLVRRMARRPVGPSPAREQPAVTDAVDEGEREILDAVRPYTMTSPDRVLAAVDAVAHVVDQDVPGALVECGVWRGGSVLSMIMQLQRMHVSDRDIYLFDTFEGMTAPTEHDTSRFEAPALKTWEHARGAGQRAWEFVFRPDVFNIEDVDRLLTNTGYPRSRLHFVPGKVEDTVPEQAPGEIALLRLDTDWYESTRHELEHLFPRLSSGGVLIIDDYGHWEGCRRAVDEYFARSATRPLLARIDYTGRIGVKR